MIQIKIFQKVEAQKVVEEANQWLKEKEHGIDFKSGRIQQVGQAANAASYLISIFYSDKPTDNQHG